MKSVAVPSAEGDILKNSCDCAERFQVRLGRSNEYDAFKKILNAGKHPTFIGREMYGRNCQNGGALFYDLDGKPIATSLINPHYGILLVLNIKPEHRSHGLGNAILNFLIPNFIRAVENKVEWFEKRGYRRIGQMKQGRTLKTQVMARSALFDLAGRVSRLFSSRIKEKNDPQTIKKTIVKSRH